jgi:hypothetical protein
MSKLEHRTDLPRFTTRHRVGTRSELESPELRSEQEVGAGEVREPGLELGLGSRSPEPGVEP